VVPSGKHLYELVVTNTSTDGCHGTVYYKPAQLGKPLTDPELLRGDVAIVPGRSQLHVTQH
jgi:hypothetical protein